MTRRTPVLLRLRPSGRKFSAIEQADEERIKGAGLKARFAGQVVSMTPLLGLAEQALQNTLSRLRKSRSWLHGIKSTYID